LRPGVIDGSIEIVDVAMPVKVFVPVDVPLRVMIGVGATG